MAPLQFHTNHVYNGNILPSSDRILILAKLWDILLVCLSGLCAIEHADRKDAGVPA